VRPVLLRSGLVIGIGAVVLGAILYYASTVDGKPPVVDRISLTQHTAADESMALATTTVEIEFSEPVRTAGAEQAFRIEPLVEGEFAWSGTTMTFTPAQRLPLEADYRVWIAAGVQDIAGNAMAQDSDVFAFATVGPPSVASTDPVDGATEVALDGPIVIEFATLMDTASVEQALTVSPGFALETTWNAERMSLTPTDQLAEGTRYTITIGTGARDSTGSPLAAPFRFSFTTTRSPLEPTLLVPAPGSDGVATTTPIAIYFDREIDPDTVSGSGLSIEPNAAGSLQLIAPPGAAGIRDPSRRIIRFQPSAPLQPNTTYHVVLEAGASASDGTELSQPVEWSFTTGAPLATLNNQILFLSDRAGVANLWAMNPDGSAQRQLSSELSPVVSYAASPDGRRYLVADGAVLVLQNANGSGRVVLTAADALEYDPAWAPDGTRFAFGRTDRASGIGEGLWLRDEDGGDATRIQLPPELRPASAPTPLPEPAGIGAGERLRAPRFSPDGGALAFVDMVGRVGVLELPAARLTTAPYVAVGPPVWFRDSSGVLVTGIDGLPLEATAPGQPAPELTPGGLGLTRVQLDSLQIGQLDRGGASIDSLDLAGAASRPALSREQLLFVVADPSLGGASGALWLADDPFAPRADLRLLDDGGAPVVSAAFGNEPEAIVAARLDDGIWRVDATTGEGVRLTSDGWLPSWLP
jgi:hypothetical protein